MARWRGSGLQRRGGPIVARHPERVTARRLSRAVRVAVEAEGSFVAVNNHISQSVPHLHVHVVPRSRGDGLRGFFWPRTRYAAGEESGYAQRLRDALS